MNKETYEALESVVKKTRSLLNGKYDNRKRLNQDEVWEQATTIRDITQLEVWIDEVKKDYEA